MNSKTKNPSKTILIVEDDPGVARLQRWRLQRAGYRVAVTNTGAEALVRVAAGDIELVLLDYRLPGQETGLEVYAQLKAAGHDLPVILVTGFSDESVAIQALRAGVRDFVSKSVEYLDYLPEAVERVLEQERMRESVRSLQDQLRQAQKIEAIGRLAGGVAHDFNNLLTVIMGYSDMALDQLEPEGPLYEQLTEILEASQRAASLTGQLLAFSRQQVVAPQIVDLNAVIENLQRMLERLLGADIDMRSVLEPNLGRISADIGQLEQVIVNLAVNARDAMPSGGRLILETTAVDVDETFSSTHLHVAPGRYTMLAVSDDGCGMDDETQARIFEPFFTTKEAGKGTGLGLSTVYGIVTQCGGHVFVYSEPGLGTTFKIYFPEISEKGVPRQDGQQPRGRLSGCETVLVAEDQAAVRALARQILTRHGYRVLEAADAQEACERLEHWEGSVDLLLTDVVMPGESGRQLAERLRAADPRLKILYMSGYTGELLSHRDFDSGEHGFLQKPFSAASLLSAVRSVLDRPTEAELCGAATTLNAAGPQPKV